MKRPSEGAFDPPPLEGPGGKSGAGRASVDPPRTTNNSEGEGATHSTRYGPVTVTGTLRPLVVFLTRPDGATVPAPYLLNVDDVADLFRLRESGCRFHVSAIARYRRLGLHSVRVGRRVWFRLDDTLAFLDAQQARLRVGKYPQNDRVCVRQSVAEL